MEITKVIVMVAMGGTVRAHEMYAVIDHDKKDANADGVLAYFNVASQAHSYCVAFMKEEVN